MRYFTKDWYMAMQMTGSHELFETDERAAQRDESLFEELFERETEERREWIEDSIKMCDTAEELDGWPNHLYELYELTGDEAHKSTHAAYEYYQRHPEILPEVMLLQLRDHMIYNRKFYPKELLDMVADERVFAYRVAAPHVIERIKELAEEAERFMKAGFQQVREREEALKGRVPEDFLNYLNLHDSRVTDLRREGNDLIIGIGEENYDNQYEVTQIHLHDCEIEYMDEISDSALQWCYRELDMTEDGRLSLNILCYQYPPEEKRATTTARECLRQFCLTARRVTFQRRDGAQERELFHARVNEELERMGIRKEKIMDARVWDEAERRVWEKYGPVEGITLTPAEEVETWLEEIVEKCNERLGDREE